MVHLGHHPLALCPLTRPCRPPRRKVGPNFCVSFFSTVTVSTDIEIMVCFPPSSAALRFQIAWNLPVPLLFEDVKAASRTCCADGRSMPRILVHYVFSMLLPGRVRPGDVSKGMIRSLKILRNLFGHGFAVYPRTHLRSKRGKCQFHTMVTGTRGGKKFM